MSQTQDKPDRTSTTPTPRWVKMSGIIFIILVLLVGIMLATGHGPGSHTPPAPAIENGTHQP